MTLGFSVVFFCACAEGKKKELNKIKQVIFTAIAFLHKLIDASKAGKYELP
jgi:hypothetical protein